jgi:hypothetical protein
MRQIHCAIEHLKEGHYEAAITLAARPKACCLKLKRGIYVKPLRRCRNAWTSRRSSKNPNACIHWLKHGTVDGKRVEAITIPAEETMVIVCRAMTKFNALYSDMSPQMVAFHGIATRWTATHQG